MTKDQFLKLADRCAARGQTITGVDNECSRCGQPLEPDIGMPYSVVDGVLSFACDTCAVGLFHGISPALHVAFNNCASNDPCALCGSRCEPEVGLEVFKGGTCALVCDECSSRIAPDLFAVVERDRKERADNIPLPF